MLTVMKLFKLAPRSAFHLGQRGVGVEGTQVFLHADTLFSALCLTYRELDRMGSAALTQLLDRFPRSGGPMEVPPFRLTSAFPYAGDVLFFPKPLLPGNLDKKTSEEHGKTLKGIGFVSQRIFTAWLNNESLDDYLEDDNFLHGGDLWVTPTERKALVDFRNEKTGAIQLWKVGAAPRVTVDRVTNKSAVYQAGLVRYQRGKTTDGEQLAGLWVLVDWPNGEPKPAQVARMKELFTVLGDSGVGGERSVGYGQFDLEDPVDFGFGIGGLGKRWLTLSPYHPRPDEMGEGGVLGKGCAYTLLVRRGWVASPEGMSFRRPLVRVLGEGSVLHHPADRARQNYGGLVDVTPTIMDPVKGGVGHKVWRYGIAFPVPVGIPIPKEGRAA